MIHIKYFFIRNFYFFVYPYQTLKMTGWKIKHGGVIKDASRHFNYKYLGNDRFLKTNK